MKLIPLGAAALTLALTLPAQAEMSDSEREAFRNEVRAYLLEHPEVLMEAGLISRKHLVKILGRGTLSAKLEVEAHAFSKSAEEAITSAGGTAVKL